MIPEEGIEDDSGDKSVKLLLRVSNRLFLLDCVDTIARPMLVGMAYEYNPTP